MELTITYPNKPAAPEMSLWEISNSLYRAGLIDEYEAFKLYVAERDRLLEELWQLRVPL